MKYENIHEPHSCEMHRYFSYCRENTTSLFSPAFKESKGEELKPDFPYYFLWNGFCKYTCRLEDDFTWQSYSVHLQRGPQNRGALIKCYSLLPFAKQAASSLCSPLCPIHKQTAQTTLDSKLSPCLISFVIDSLPATALKSAWEHKYSLLSLLQC